VIPRALPNPRQAILACAGVAATGVVCGALVVAAALVPAPAAVLPLIALVCIGCPIAMAWELPTAIAVLRARRANAAVEEEALLLLRRHLDCLPETEHPLGH
jgi:hypothetical protein